MNIFTKKTVTDNFDSLTEAVANFFHHPSTTPMPNSAAPAKQQETKTTNPFDSNIIGGIIATQIATIAQLSELLQLLNNAEIKTYAIKQRVSLWLFIGFVLTANVGSAIEINKYNNKGNNENENLLTQFNWMAWPLISTVIASSIYICKRKCCPTSFADLQTDDDNDNAHEKEFLQLKEYFSKLSESRKLTELQSTIWEKQSVGVLLKRIDNLLTSTFDILLNTAKQILANKPTSQLLVHIGSFLLSKIKLPENREALPEPIEIRKQAMATVIKLAALLPRLKGHGLLAELKYILSKENQTALDQKPRDTNYYFDKDCINKTLQAIEKQSQLLDAKNHESKASYKSCLLL